MTDEREAVSFIFISSKSRAPSLSLPLDSRRTAVQLRNVFTGQNVVNTEGSRLPRAAAKKISEGRNEPNSSRPSSYLSTCGIHVSVARTRKYTGKDTWSRRTALRAEIPRETASGLPRSPRSSAFFPTNAGRREREIPFLPFTRSVLPLFRSNFPSDVRRDFRESKDPILSRLSGTRESPGPSRVLRPSSHPSRRIRYSFIYSLAVANNGSCSLRRGIDRTFGIRGLLRMCSVCCR